MIKSRIRIIIVYLVLIIFAALLGFTYSFEKPTPIQTAEVSFGNIEAVVEMSGYIDSQDTETIISNTEGIIGGLAIKEGDRVSRGKGLCVIRSPKLRKTLLEMRAELITARTNMNTATTASARNLARARVNFIQANIADIAETMRPKAHINGEVIKVDVQNGSKIVPGMKLFFLADVDRPILKARMDESDIQKVKAGQPIWVSGDFLSGRKLQGKVSQISGFVTRDGGTYVETTCKIFNPDNLVLKFGAYADVSVVTGRKKDILLIPKEALIMEKGAHVFVAKNDRAHLTPIEVGIIGESQAEVVAGLKKGERVVTTGSLDISDGERIKVSTF
jgi:RND family efflux transporter MFP subunit